MISFLNLPGGSVGPGDDAGAATLRHAAVLRSNRFLRRLYEEFYQVFADSLAGAPAIGACVELGSGGGFLKEVIPSVITSDILALPGVDRQFSVLSMPFADSSVRAFFMLNTLHHVADPAQFFSEMQRCLVPGGRIVAIEPANTLLGRFIYTHFHHEPFDPAAGWEIGDRGSPLLTANGALPWIIFTRDRTLFQSRYPLLHLDSIDLHTPLAYLLSGGFTLRQLVPASLFGAVRGIERVISPLRGLTALFQTITITRSAAA
jgi:SAM-dependent methyltransferase